MIYTAIFLNSANHYGYDVYDAPHGFQNAWPTIEKQMQRGHRLIALVPGKHEVASESNLVSGQVSFSAARINVSPFD